jgi:hypothetical protein
MVIYVNLSSYNNSSLYFIAWFRNGVLNRTDLMQPRKNNYSTYSLSSKLFFQLFLTSTAAEAPSICY